MLHALYEGAVTEDEQNQIEQGTMYIRTSRLRLDSRFHGEWQTTLPPFGESNPGDSN